MSNPSETPLKVLHVVADLLPGGAEVLMKNLLEYQHENRACENVVVTLEDHGEDNSLLPEIEQLAEVYNLGCNSFFSKPFRQKFQEVLTDERPDVVHTWGYDSGLVAGMLARFRFGIKVVWAIHSLDLPSRHEYGVFRFAVLKGLVGLGSRMIPHRIISCSDVATDSHVRFGYPRSKCLTIANGVDTKKFQPDADAASVLQKSLGISSNAQVLGYLGRSHPVKRLEDFFQVASQILQERPNLHVVALGFDEGDLYPEAKKAFEQIPDRSRLHLLGSRSDVEACLPAFSVNVLTSESEALPMVLMEALCCGVPCITTDVGASAQVVGSIGASVPVGETEQLAAVISEWLDKVGQNEAEWRQQARQRGVEHYSIEQTEQAHTQVYRELAGKDVATTSGPQVIHLINDTDFGGAQVVLHRLAKGLQQEGFQQKVVSVLPLGRLAPGFVESGIKTESIGVRGLWSGWLGVLRLAKMIRQEKPDILQTWMLHSALIGEIAAKLSFTRCKVLWSIHNTNLTKESAKLTTRMLLRLLSWLSPILPKRIIYCSKSGVDLHHDDGFCESKTELIYNGTDQTFYQPDADKAARFRDQYGIPHDAPLVGMAGRYHAQKDYPNLLRSFALLQKMIPEAHLVACGPDVTRDTEVLRELAEACPSPEQVHLIGPRLDMENVYPALSISALSSCEGEAFPLVLGEAMACEVPCVATDVGDSALIIGDTGYTVEPQDPQALADAMVKLLSKDLNVEGRRARQRVIEHFSLVRYVQSHADLYRKLTYPIPNKVSQLPPQAGRVIGSAMQNSP